MGDSIARRLQVAAVPSGALWHWQPKRCQANILQTVKAGMVASGHRHCANLVSRARDWARCGSVEAAGAEAAEAQGNGGDDAGLLEHMYVMFERLITARVCSFSSSSTFFCKRTFVTAVTTLPRPVCPACPASPSRPGPLRSGPLPRRRRRHRSSRVCQASPAWPCRRQCPSRS